ncbi:MAG: NAD(P)-binding domain-containing protein [Alphaproteobacteria bacterium]|nr:NAD(P)-binding domain-containing protein [Alphaproteobacteria bacterium]
MIVNRKICVLGLGSMGMGVALSLLERQFEVVGFDVNKNAMKGLEEAGGTVKNSVKSAVENCIAVIVLVVNDKQVEDVLFGIDGAVEGLSSGAVVIQSSTVPAAYAKECGNRLLDHGFEMIDAPVSGGVAGARSANLSIMASGPDSAFEKVVDIMDAISGKIYRLGSEYGIGSTVKTVNQLLAGVHIAAAAEAMAFGVRAGANPRELYDVISGSAGSSWMWQNRVPHILDADYAPLSAVDIFVKDLGIVLGTGQEMRFPLPLTAAAHQQFLAAAASGFGREDDSAVFKVFQKLSDIKIKEHEQANG